MSVEMLKLVGINKMNCEIQKVEAEGHLDLEFKLYDRNNHCHFLYIDRSQAHLMMLYLQEYLTVGKNDV